MFEFRFSFFHRINFFFHKIFFLVLIDEMILKSDEFSRDQSRRLNKNSMTANSD